MRTTPETILAIDPGLRELGYAVLQGSRLKARGVFNLRLLPKAQRLEAARNELRGLLNAHHPGVVILEKTYRHPVPWLNQLHDLARSAQNLATRSGAAFVMYSPQRVRQTVAGNGRAKKNEVAIAVSHRFRELRVYVTQDRRWKERLWLNMFDAVALALHHQSTQPPSRSR